MRAADLMREDLVDVGVLPTERRARFLPCFHREIDPGVQQCFGIGLHARSVVAVNRRFDPAGTQFVGVRVSAELAAEKPVSRPAEFRVADNDRRRTGTIPSFNTVTFEFN